MPATRISLITLAFLACSCLADDWPMLGHDAARSGGTATDLRPPFARKWYRLFPDEGLQSGVQPVIADGKVFVGTMRGVLHALDAETGRDVWTFKAGGPILHTAAVADGLVFFGSADGHVHALRITNGQPAWSFKTGAAVWNAPAVHAGTLLIGSRDGQLYALEASTGKVRWEADAGAPLLNSPAVDAVRGRVYIGSEAMCVHAFALADGQPLWRSSKLPGVSMRGYHPVIAPDGAVLVTTQPVIGYDRMQQLLLDMTREVFGDFASWRHKKEDNDRLRRENFIKMEKPETYTAQLDYLRRRLAEEPAFQTFFVLDPVTGRPRFVAPILASESMNGPGAPPLVTPQGRVIVKYQALLRSRYEQYSPFLNVGYLDTATGHITPLMDQARTYGWHDSLLLVHDEQCQLSFAGGVLLNTHQDNVNAMDLETLKGWEQPLALNVHEPAPGEALAIRLAGLRQNELPPGSEWFIRGTAVYGGGSVLDVPVAIAGDSFYYLPTHEINSGCAVIAYRATPGTPSPKKTGLPMAKLTDEEWKRIQSLPWDWDSLATPRLKNLPDALPGKVPGTVAAPLTTEAERKVAAISDRDLDEFIWKEWPSPATNAAVAANHSVLVERLRFTVRELISTRWQPLVMPAGKAPEEAWRFFNDPSETLLTLLLARPFLDPDLKHQVDLHLRTLLEGGLRRAYDPDDGKPRTAYDAPRKLMRIAEETGRDDLARLYPLRLWSRTPTGADFVEKNWKDLRGRLRVVPSRTDDDCGNARLAGLIAYCRLARAAGDQPALDEALPLTRQALRTRLVYELAHTRGGVMRVVGQGRSVLGRWRHLTPEVANFLVAYALPIERDLMATFVDHLRPGWWLAWNVEQLMRNESPTQLPSTPLEIFTARALLLGESPDQLAAFLDLPWCRADEFHIQKIALTLRAAGR